MLRAAVTACAQPILLLLPHEPLLLLPEDAAVALASALVLDACKEQAARVRTRASEVFVRFLGGDVSLVRDVMRNRELQETLLT